VGPGEELAGGGTGDAVGAADVVGAGGAVVGVETGAVLPYRLMMAALPVCASPAGTPMHGGGGITTPL
jgi:hypothetical protein